MQNPFEIAEKLLAEIVAENPKNSEEVEQFRIKYIGSKGILKNIFVL